MLPNSILFNIILTERKMLFLTKFSIMARYLAFIIISLLIISHKAVGQSPEEPESVNGNLSLSIKNINFVKDNEYFNNIKTSKFILVSGLPGFTDKSQWAEGYTLVGFFFQPELVYTPTEKITVRAGVHLLKYTGLEKFSQVKPVVSASLKLTENTSVTVGSLAGSNSHKLFDPHFSSERLYSNYSEDGFQVTTATDHVFSDNWLSWENYIVEGDSVREVFTTGESFKYTSSPIGNIMQLEVPVQVQFKHFGGQISNFREHVETYFNLATGLKLNFDLAGQRYGKAGLEYLQFLNGEFPKEPVSGITNGHASWYRIHYNYKSIYFGLYYWKSHNYFAPNGNPIYGSVINTTSKYVIADRKIVTGSLFMNLLPENYLELHVGVESYYDVTQKRIDAAITLHLNFNKLFKLATLRD